MRRAGTAIGAMPWLPVLLALSSCSDPYPLPPTRCDDFCYATQRAGCLEDDPEGCVSECESRGFLRQAPECGQAWDARNACYLEAAGSEFTCVEDLSAPSGDLCMDERRALIGCVSPLASLCFENCVRDQDTCGGDPGRCDEDCLAQDNRCEERAAAFFRCALRAPVSCIPPEDDDRMPEEIPCLGEIGAWFACLE